MRYEADSKKWQLDRQIPISVLLLMVGQTLAGVWFFSRFEATTLIRLNALESQVTAYSSVNERLARLEVVTSNNSQMLSDIRSSLMRSKL